MEQILIEITKEDLDEEFSFIKKISDKGNWQKRKKYIFVLTGATIVIFLVFLFTASYSFIVFKAVFSCLLFLAWLTTLLLAILFFLKRSKDFSKLRNAYDKVLEKPQQQYVIFDEDKITISATDFKTELNWSYYGCYFLEDGAQLYLFVRNSYSITYYSSKKIGAENFNTLKQIVQTKLKPLEDFVFVKDFYHVLAKTLIGDKAKK
jgi:hypothetical protein